MAKEYPCILTLDPGIGIISNKQDMTAYVIRQYFGTPGRISDTYGSMVKSFRETKSLYHTYPETMAQAVINCLKEVLERLMPTDNINVTCKVIPYETDNRYDIEIGVTIENQFGIYEPILTWADVKVVNDEFTVILKGDQNR